MPWYQISGFIRGPGENPKPMAFSFHDKFKQGPLLSVVSPCMAFSFCVLPCVCLFISSMNICEIKFYDEYQFACAEAQVQWLYQYTRKYILLKIILTKFWKCFVKVLNLLKYLWCSDWAHFPLCSVGAVDFAVPTPLYFVLMFFPSLGSVWIFVSTANWFCNPRGVCILNTTKKKKKNRRGLCIMTV